MFHCNKSVIVLLILFASLINLSLSFNHVSTFKINTITRKQTLQNIHKNEVLYQRNTQNNLQMNIFEDGFRFFTNLNKEASAKHILIKGPGASEKLLKLKEELNNAPDVSAAFSEVAAKVSQCPSANRGGNLGTFKPGMMVRELDKICFEKEIGVIHGPVETQFGSHLVIVTRRYEGENKDKK